MYLKRRHLIKSQRRLYVSSKTLRLLLILSGRVFLREIVCVSVTQGPKDSEQVPGGRRLKI